MLWRYGAWMARRSWNLWIEFETEPPAFCEAGGLVLNAWRHRVSCIWQHSRHAKNRVLNA